MKTDSRAGRGHESDDCSRGADEEGKGVLAHEGEVDESDEHYARHEVPDHLRQDKESQAFEGGHEVSGAGDGLGDQAGHSDWRQPVQE